MFAAPVERGCGSSRSEDGIYLEVASGPGGSPLECFVTDRPLPFSADHKRGVELRQGPDGLTHVVDHVGSVHYPYPSDVLEEGRLWGFSRRISGQLDFSELSAGSRLLLVHARAVLLNADELQPHFAYESRSRCAHAERGGGPAHFDTAGACSRAWYVLAPGNEYKLRVFTSVTRYPVHPLPEGLPEPRWASGIIASLPIGGISVVAAKDGRHEDTIAKVRASGTNLRTEVVDA